MSAEVQDADNLGEGNVDSSVKEVESSVTEIIPPTVLPTVSTALSQAPCEVDIDFVNHSNFIASLDGFVGESTPVRSSPGEHSLFGTCTPEKIDLSETFPIVEQSVKLKMDNVTVRKRSKTTKIVCPTGFKCVTPIVEKRGRRKKKKKGEGCKPPDYELKRKRCKNPVPPPEMSDDSDFA